MTRTIDKMKEKQIKNVNDLEKLLLRAQLDRSQMINEKFYCIWKKQESRNAQEMKEERMRATMRILGKSPPDNDRIRTRRANSNLPHATMHRTAGRFSSNENISLKDAKSS